MVDPVIASDEQTYERTAIETWFQIKNTSGKPITSPCTGLAMEDTVLLSNVALKNVLEELRLQLVSEGIRNRHHNIREALYSKNCDIIPEIADLTKALSSDVFEALDSLMHLVSLFIV